MVVSILLLGAILAGLVWANLHFTRSWGGGTDFLVQWLSIRTFATSGVNPYDEGIRAELERMVYGQDAGSGQQKLKLISPLYLGALDLPFALTSDFPLARALWMLLLQAALALLAWLSIRLVNWRARWFSLLPLFLFIFFSYHGLRALVSGNPAILTALLIVWMLLALRSRRDELTGFLLALTTIQPQIVVFLVIFILLWTAAQRRWGVIVWFFASLAIMTTLGIFFSAEWPLEYLRVLWRYREFFPLGSPGRAFHTWWPGLGRQLGWLLTILLGGLLAVEWFAAIRKDFRWFLWTVCLTLAVSPWLGVPTDPRYFVTLFPVLILVLSVMEERMGASGRWLGLAGLLILFVGQWGLFAVRLSAETLDQQQFAFLFHLPLTAIIGLYWVRWWAIRPPRLYVEELRKNEVVP